MAMHPLMALIHEVNDKRCGFIIVLPMALHVIFVLVGCVAGQDESRAPVSCDIVILNGREAFGAAARLIFCINNPQPQIWSTQ
jgi:hypothetical protein